MKAAMCTSLSDSQDSRLFFLSCTTTLEMLWHSWWKVAFKIQRLLLSMVGFAKLRSGWLITHLPMWGGNLMCSDLLQHHNNKLAI
jgi:hypothetical protein